MKKEMLSYSGNTECCPKAHCGFVEHVFKMADNNESLEKRKKHKKKPKKSTKSSAEERESAAFESADTNASQNEKTVTPEQSPVAPKESKVTPGIMAPKLQSSNEPWSFDQEETLLKNIKKYTAKLKGKQQYWQRVDWSRVDQVDNFTQVGKHQGGCNSIQHKLVLNRL